MARKGMRLRASLVALPGLLLATAAAQGPLHAGAAGSGLTTFTTQSNLHFTATGLGPNAQSCDIVYDLYVPADAGPTHQVPAILTTNGFGGSKNDQASVAALLATHDYEVLSYSGLGFGGSSCSIELDSPEWDGRAASQLVSLLGNRPEVAKKGLDNPVIGTWGGSYGGGFQFALASVDPRIDAMIPQITWNDLSYSLAPNNGPVDRSYASAPPGAPKFEWTNVFFADGMAQPALNPGTSGNPPTGCPGFDREVCTANAETAASGYAPPDVIAFLQHASAESELFDKAGTHVPPMMLMQGQNDTLFNFSDALANFDGAKRRGAPVKLVLKEGGHSGPDAPGEVNDADPSKGYLDQLYLNWYDRYLKHLPVDTGPEVEFFQDWVTYDHNGSAQPAYGSAPSWPVGPVRQMYLSGGSSGSPGALVTDPGSVTAGSQTFVNPPGGQPSSYSETSEAGQLTAPSDPPGEFAAWQTPPLAADTDVVGVPELTFSVSAPATSNLDPATELVLFGKLYDVDAAGNATLVHGIVSPLRVADTSTPVHIYLPGQVHRYAAGHRIELVLASTDSAYLGSRIPGPITVSVDPAHPSVLSLPLGPAAAPGATLPEAPSSALLLLLALPLAAGGGRLAHRRRRRAAAG